MERQVLETPWGWVSYRPYDLQLGSRFVTSEDQEVTVASLAPLRFTVVVGQDEEDYDR